MPKRLFAALDPGIKGLRWLPADQLHLTLGFFGELDEPLCTHLQQTMENVHVPSFFLPLEGMGVFGGARPSVVWAGVGKGHPHLFALHKQIQDAALSAGVEPDLRSFHPHVTLARAKDLSRQALNPFLRKHVETSFDFWKVTGFALISSTLSKSGPAYITEAHWPLC